MALYETYSIQGETLSDIAEAIREKTGTDDPIQTTNMSNMIRDIQGGSPNAVLFTEQNLTEEQKAQARENIGAAEEGTVEGAVLYTEQILQPEQKNQARKNIDIHVGEEPTDADEGAVWFDPNDTSFILGNAIMAEDTNEGDVEIFGSFVSEDTVVAKDENSDGNINLQTFVKGEGPSIEYATKEELAALTAEDVGARPNTWMPTAADVGAAPAGYGLGVTVKDINVTDLNTSVSNGWYRIAGQSLTVGGYTYSDWYVHVSKYSSSYLVQEMYTLNGYKVIRRCQNGTWYEEWESPPMYVNTEYRTTERDGGKIVYVMRIDCETLPNTTSKSVSTTIPGTANIVSAVGIAIDSTGAAEPMPCISSSGTVKCAFFITAGRNININAFANMSTYTGYITIRYTKD